MLRWERVGLNYYRGPWLSVVARRRDCNDVASPHLSVKLRDRFNPAHRFSLCARVQLSDLPGNPPSNYRGACIGYDQPQLTHALCTAPFTHRPHSLGCLSHVVPHRNALQRNALRNIYQRAHAGRVRLSGLRVIGGTVTPPE